MTPIDGRRDICERTIDAHGVVDVRELLTGSRNLHVEVIAMDSAAVERIAEELDALGLEIERSEILRREYHQPFDGFGNDVVDSEADGN